MKTIFTLLALLPIFAFSAEYKTLKGGDWNDNSSVWSLDGINPCACAPEGSISGHTIDISHVINMNVNLILDNGAIVTVTSSGKLDGPLNTVNIINGDLILDGNATFDKLTIENNGFLDAENMEISINSRLNVHGLFSMMNGRMILGNGNLRIPLDGIFHFGGSTKISLANGNVSNYGIIEFIGSNCLEIINGNLVNETSGVLSGDGVILVPNGNIQNYGLIKNTIIWCANGNSVGMTTIENCDLTQEICESFGPLPVQLISFNGRVLEGYNEIYWSTASELNSDYYDVLKSDNGYDWYSIDKIQAAGNSTSQIDYLTRDDDQNQGVQFYMLRQYDFNGEYYSSYIISLKTKETPFIRVFPNPNNGNFIIVTESKEIDEIAIADIRGCQVYHEQSSRDHSINEINSSLDAGIYFLQVRIGSQIETIRITLN